MTYALAAVETALVVILAAASWSRERGWAQAGVVAAGTWTLVFLIPSWVFAADPSLLTVGSRNGAIATVDLSLLCFIAGYLARRRTTRTLLPASRPLTPVRSRETSLDPRWLTAWTVLGLFGLTVLFAATGGPIHYLRNLSNEGAMTRGRTYFIYAGVATVWVAQCIVCMRWLNGRGAGRLPLLALAAALVLVAIIGARELVAVPLLELALFYWIVRRRISGRLAAVVVLLAVFVVVFVFGMAKRYGNYLIEHPGTHISRIDFMFTSGPGDFARSYATNTADGVLLIALGEHVVPSQAPPELGKEFLRLALQVLPSSIRPTVATAPAIETAIYPSKTNSYAQPLQLVAYLQFELPGVIVAFLVIGAAAAQIDVWLASERQYRLSTLLLLVALATAIAMLLRDADSGATAGAIIEVVGIWAVARTSERLSP
jgi:hypothetical protein